MVTRPTPPSPGPRLPNPGAHDEQGTPPPDPPRRPPPPNQSWAAERADVLRVLGHLLAAGTNQADTIDSILQRLDNIEPYLDSVDDRP